MVEWAIGILAGLVALYVLVRLGLAWLFRKKRYKG